MAAHDSNPKWLTPAFLLQMAGIIFICGTMYASFSQVSSELADVKTQIKTFVTQEQFRLLSSRVDDIERHLRTTPSKGAPHE
jgi:hypothetical protein